MKTKNHLTKIPLYSAFVVLLAGGLCPLFSRASDMPQNVVRSSDGISRTVLETHDVPGTDQETKMVLTVYPPGVGLPSHHHPSPALNYILEGAAESQYAGESLKVFNAGESFQDKPNLQHLIFRNADKNRPLKYIIVYTVKKGAPFLEVP